MRNTPLVDQLNRLPGLRLFIFDACFAESAEQDTCFGKNIRRWYAAPSDRSALGCGPRFYYPAIDRFFAQRLRCPGLRVRNVSLFALFLAAAIHDISQENLETWNEAQLFRSIEGVARTLRTVAHARRVPIPVRHAAADSAGFVLYRSLQSTAESINKPTLREKAQ
jgi:hypothetical protein